MDSLKSEAISWPGKSQCLLSAFKWEFKGVGGSSVFVKSTCVFFVSSRKAFLSATGVVGSIHFVLLVFQSLGHLFSIGFEWL